MRRIDKSRTPNALTVYAAKNPNGKWTTFKSNNSKDAELIKKKIFDEQGDICAYCETDLSHENVFEHYRRVEHFNSKSGWVVGQAQPNWHLDWSNVIGVCVGGTDRDNLDQYVMPDNKSCDSYKEHLETNCGYEKKWLGQVVSPLETALCCDMFNYSLASGALGVNNAYADTITFNHNNHLTSSELLEKTLEVFNLNCDRLNQARRKISHDYERLKAEFRKSKDRDKFKFKLEKWGDKNKILSFQTTRDILIRECTIAQKILNP